MKTILRGKKIVQDQKSHSSPIKPIIKNVCIIQLMETNVNGKYENLNDMGTVQVETILR